MRAFSSIPLAGLFVLVAAFNVWIMLSDHGPTPRRRRMWTQVDRVCVYTFIALFVIFCYFMLLRTRSADELSPRVGLHLALALILAPLLLIKVIVVRYQKSAWHVLMTLGGHDFCHGVHAGVVHGGHDRISLWIEGSGFFRDVLKLPDGSMFPMKVRSVVGLIRLFAVETLEPELLQKFPAFKRRLEWFIGNRPDLTRHLASMRVPGKAERRLISIVNEEQLGHTLKYMLDGRELLSPCAICELSCFREENPYVLRLNGTEHRVDYQPGDSTTGIVGGNSNWRGPICFSLNFLFIESAAETSSLLRRRPCCGVSDRVRKKDDFLASSGGIVPPPDEHPLRAMPAIGGRRCGAYCTSRDATPAITSPGRGNHLNVQQSPLS